MRPIHQLSKALALLAPTLAFIWIDQLAYPKREIFGFILIIIIAGIAGSFWKSIVASNESAAQKSLQNRHLPLVAGNILLLMLILVCYLFPLGGYLAQPLVVEHSGEKAEAILVLASGATETGDPQLSGLQRVTHGIKLLKQGQAPHLYLSTGFSHRTGYAEAGWVASYTDLIGLDPASFTIFVSPEITTTFTEAAYARKTLQAKGINTILLVTSGAHIYRSCLTFRKAGFNVLPAPAHNLNNVFYSSENYLTSMRAVLHEWLGLIYYRLRGRI